MYKITRIYMTRRAVMYGDYKYSFTNWYFISSLVPPASPLTLLAVGAILTRYFAILNVLY